MKGGKCKDETPKMIQKNKRWLHRKPIRFAVNIVSCGVYPELDRNPGNFFVQMTEKDRTEEFMEILGMLWAETTRQETKTSEETAKGHTGL